MVSAGRKALVSLVALGTAAAVAAVPAMSQAAGNAKSTVVAKNLDGPFGLAKAIDHRGFVVAEGDSGQVTRVYLDGRKHAILNGIGGVAGIATSSKHVFAVIG